MKILRQPWARRIFSLCTGLLFLNMSFLLSGISFLNPENRQMIENVGKLVLNEEEKDSHDGHAEHVSPPPEFQQRPA